MSHDLKAEVGYPLLACFRAVHAQVVGPPPALPFRRRLNAKLAKLEVGAVALHCLLLRGDVLRGVVEMTIRGHRMGLVKLDKRLQGAKGAHVTAHLAACDAPV